jgi:hypothetical protein
MEYLKARKIVTKLLVDTNFINKGDTLLFELGKSKIPDVYDYVDLYMVGIDIKDAIYCVYTELKDVDIVLSKRFFYIMFLIGKQSIFNIIKPYC